MKIILLVLLIQSSFIQLSAQNENMLPPISMLEGNPVWEYYYTEPKMDFDIETNEIISTKELSWFYLYYIDGTMELDGKTYYKLFMRSYNPNTYSDSETGISSPSFLCALREENGRVLIYRQHALGIFKGISPVRDKYPPYKLNDETLMDFSLNAGDIIDGSFYTSYKDSVYMTIDSVWTETMLNGDERKSMSITYWWYNNTTIPVSGNFLSFSGIQVIEGIGYMSDFFAPEVFRITSGRFCEHLNRFWQNGKLIYQAPDYVGDPRKRCLSNNTFRENPAINQLLSVTGIVPVQHAAGVSKQENTLFDLQGRQLRHEPEKGLYIQNGKVRMAR